MTEAMAMKIFDKYNPKEDVVRCPYGRADVRKQLDLYAVAAVNLYGIVEKKKLVEIFNEQNYDKTSEEEAYVLLLPLVLKEGWYCFYKEYIVHYFYFKNFKYADNLLSHQANKEYYVPKKEEFLKYANEYYSDNKAWDKLLMFMIKAFEGKENIYKAFTEIKNYLIYDDGIEQIGPILERNGLHLQSEESLQKFLDHMMQGKNNERIWSNRGQTPMEAFKKQKAEKEEGDQAVKFIEMQTPGRNDPCPCGSGKKYKKCCALIEESGTANLNYQEGLLFFQIWNSLLIFVNEVTKLFPYKFIDAFPNDFPDEAKHKLREALWESPDLIDEYIKVKKPTEEATKILKLWKEKHKKGFYFFLEQNQDHALFLGSGEEGDVLYEVKGLSKPLSSFARGTLPITLETVLLPYKGKIVYDGFVNIMPISYKDGAKKLISSFYEKALTRDIITSLE